jgi:heme/copper-type cytochrome/quinol oxidase subunit 2
LESTSASKGFNKRILVGVILILIAIAGVFGYYQFSTAPKATTETIRVEIKAVMQDGVERHVFDPATVTAHKSEHIILIVTNTDELPHGIVIPQLNLDTGRLREDQQAMLEFDANIIGTYSILCSVPGCAPDHAQMLGQLIVSE